MISINKHKFYLVQILKDIYSDADLMNCMGFKGGTALMFFYDLPRFSVDLDFNLLSPKNQILVYNKIREIACKYGNIHDEAKKYYGDIVVLDYGTHQRKLKIEISNRNFNDKYEIKNLLGISVRVMKPENMLTHKLCALLDRNSIANRDIFDAWFLMNNKTPVIPEIIELRMQKQLPEYLRDCIGAIENISDKSLLNGLGELLNPELKNFVKNKLRTEVITMLKFYRDFPILN